MKTAYSDPQTQSGIMLLEAMIAILVFSLGVLALVALQGTSIKLTSDAKYRTNATLLANRLIGQMWGSAVPLAQLKTDFETGGAAYTTWQADVKNPEGLPGVVAAADGVDPTEPVVTVTINAAGTAVQVVITLFWRTPGMPLAGEPSAASCVVSRHCLTIVSLISRN